MKKVRKYYLNPSRTRLICDVHINGELKMEFHRSLVSYSVITHVVPGIDVTTFDLELHAFLRLSHQYIIDKDSVEVKIEEMFEMENPNI